MSRKKGAGIFGKIFMYTLLLLVFVITTLALFFGDQVNLIFEKSQVYFIEQPLEMANIQDDASQTIEGNVFDPQRVEDGYASVPHEDEAEPLASISDLRTDFITKTAIAIAILLAASIAMAALFARSMSNPIKKLAADTTKMSKLESVSAPAVRGDEIGQLSADVYKMYEALKSEIQREKEIEESQRYFFSAVSHELKTPVAAASGMLEGMLANVVTPAEYPEYLRKCLGMMTMQKQLIAELLEIIRLDDNKTELKMEATPLKPVIQSVLYAHQTLADAKAQTLDVCVPDTLSCVLDENLFGRALSNILINAVQNTPEEGHIRIWCEDRDSHTVRLSILNSNAHIEEASLPKLFEPFYRVDKARSRSQNRSGLGLTIVKKSLDAMKIPFAIENKDNDVVFWMDLFI